jgi:transcriptional regulator with XRE-family HTH domain
MNHGILLLNIFALNAYMQEKSTLPQKPIVTYPALVGKILAQQRETRGIKQGELAAKLGLSQSAYSRLESGDSVLNLSQLRNVAMQLGLKPAQLLQWADQYEVQLRQQGVEVISEKPDNPAAIAIGLGLLAALLMGAR